MNTLVSPHTYSEEERTAIEQQLDRLVSNGYFSNSRRFPPFLRFVVQQTLEGNPDGLKERTIGIEIFGKDADYDTATEPIVRVTAAEIRKRIAQYYQHPGHEQEVRITLPPGSYVPQFEFPPKTAPLEPKPAAAAVIPAPQALPSQPDLPAAAPAAEPPRNLRWVAFGVVLLLIAAAGLYYWSANRKSALAEFWGPVLGSSDPILFCVADQTQYTSVGLRDASNPDHLIQLKDNLTAVVIDDLNTITQLAGVLQASEHRYVLRGESATTLADLRNGPSVIVGAFDNAWTLRLLAPLRYHFANNPEMTSFSIVEGNQASHPRWTVNRQKQMATNNYEDYAIVARFTDVTTGRPTVIAAGIGRGGTIAAGEFLADPALLREVIRRLPSPHTQNLEVVLRTEIIGGEPGTPSIEATYSW